MNGFSGSCAACGHHWHVLPPDRAPMPPAVALRLMESAVCPQCGNEGRPGQPVRFHAGQDQPAASNSP